MTQKNNLFFALVGPSGAGKSTLINEIIDATKERADLPCFDLPTTATTRAIRDGEVEGVHHYFLSTKEFNARLKNDDFLEHSATHGKKYGSLKQEFEAQLNNSHLIKDLDWVGARDIRKHLPDRTFVVLVLPLTRAQADERLTGRGKSGKDRLTTLDKTAKDITTSIYFPERAFSSDDLKGSLLENYDLVIYNDELKKAVNRLYAFMVKKIDA